jgi:hypothetical protein|tara:strand:+ start:1291 stop:1932 length:642 start_codon:yes stop_codon:yes gene_type:complete
MVRVNILKPSGVDVITPAEADAGKIDVDIQKDIGVKIKPSVNIKITNNNLSTYVFELNARESLDGNLMIYDHKDIDIVLMQEQKKIVAFAKDIMTDSVYGAESRLFEFLRKKGIVAYDSIQGGNIYGSMEAKILDSKKYDSVKSALLNIAEWFKEEKPSMEYEEEHDQMMNDALLNPDDEHATELGEVPHEEEKGSILQKNLFAPYLYGRYTY